MAATVSYPGIYIQEFTPGPPIEGVGTSTAAFIGTAEQGPVGRPTRLGSWDAFQSLFGGISAEAPAATLAPALLGFFLNGGTDCFIVRAATARHSHVDLLNRAQPASNAKPLITVEAVDEGTQGDAIDVVVRDSSQLASLLPAGETSLKVHRSFAAPLGNNPVSADRGTITVTDSAPFQIGERVIIAPAAAGSAQPREGVVAAKPNATSLTLLAPITGTAAYSGGSLRSVDLAPGQREIRVDVPAGVRLDRALPHGTTVGIRLGAGTPDIRTVDTTRTSGKVATIVLTAPLTSTLSLASTPGPTVASLEFDLQVSRPGSVDPETFEHLGTNSEHPRYWGREVTSSLVTLRDAVPPSSAPTVDPRPAVATTKLNAGSDDDRAKAWTDVLNDPNPQLTTLEAFGEVDIVAIPGATSEASQSALINHCLKLADRFAILDPEPRADKEKIATQADGVRARDGFAALYWPSILVRNPTTRRVEAWPPSGHLAGVYARTDATSGVHTAPANTPIAGAIGLETRIGDIDQGPLNQNGINVLRVFPGNSTPVVWGARTTWKDNIYWRYVPIRRLFLFLENSIEQGIRWAVFQPNDLTLWADLRRVISAFLTQVWTDGALFGATPDEAFYVRIDEGLNPESERAKGRLVIEIGVAPAQPAEFIIVRIGITAAGAEISES